MVILLRHGHGLGSCREFQRGYAGTLESFESIAGLERYSDGLVGLSLAGFDHYRWVDYFERR